MYTTTADQRRLRLRMARTKLALIATDAPAAPPALSMLERLRRDREIAGYASVYGVRDRAGDVLMPGCFGRTKALRPQFIGTRKLYLNHSNLRPEPVEHIGELTDCYETAKGYYIHAVIYRTPLGDQVYAQVEKLLIEGKPPGFSIAIPEGGYNVAKHTRDGRFLSEVLICDISLVLPPAIPVNEYCRLGPP